MRREDFPKDVLTQSLSLYLWYMFVFTADSWPGFSSVLLICVYTWTAQHMFVPPAAALSEEDIPVV